MRECRRVFSRRSLLWLLVLMAAVVFFHRVDHHNAPGFAAAYRQTAAQLAASPDPSAALSQMEAESRRYMTALLWCSTDDPDLLGLLPGGKFHLGLVTEIICHGRCLIIIAQHLPGLVPV